MKRLAAALLLLASPASADLDERGTWEEADVRPQTVSVPSRSPFVLADIEDEDADAVDATFAYFPAAGDGPAPAAVLLHGADGVVARREERYARELAGQGVHVAVLDVYGARGRRRVLDRLWNTTAMTAMADAYAALEWLAEQPEVDGTKVALIGFSFGGMAAMQAAMAQVADAMAPDGPRFAAHAAYYAPCLTRFEERATTGAPVLLMWGTRDGMVDGGDCEDFAQDLRRGGSDVETMTFDAAHNWDGAQRRRRMPTSFSSCALVVDEDGMTRSRVTGMALDTVLARNTAFTFCTDIRGYWLEYDEEVRRKSSAALAAFLNPVLFP